MTLVPPDEYPSLYRAVKSKSWLKQHSAAFRLRPATDARPAERELSVILSANCSNDKCDAQQRTCFGELVVDNKSVSSKWEVHFDDPNASYFSPNHANILGLPMFGSDDLEIEEAASDLADMVNAVQERPR